MTEQTSDQGASQSLSDRIASAFGGGEPEPQVEQPEATAEATSEAETGEPSAPPAEEFEELEYEGEKLQLRKGSKIKEALMRQQDYTQKTQSLADKQRMLEHAQAQMRVAAVAQQFRDSVQSDVQALAAVEAQENYILQNWRNLSEAERAELPRVTAEVAKAKANLADKERQFIAQQQSQIQQLQAQSLEVIRKAIPNWNEATAKAVREHALSDGYTAEEVGSIHDPRHAVTLWKAQQYDALKAKAAPVQAKSPVARPGSSNPMPADVKDRLNYRKQIAKHERGSPERQRIAKDRIASIFSR